MSAQSQSCDSTRLTLSASFVYALLVVLAAATTAPACPVPVFRYGLERWAADSYDLIIFHDGEGVQAEVPPAANVRVRQVALGESLSRSMQRLWDAQQPTAMPWMVLRYPIDGAITATAWTGPATAAAIEGVWQSPARGEIARRIGQGQSAVWILLECGDPAADDAAAAVLGTELTKLQDALKLPDPPHVEGVDGDPAWPAELRIEFSILRVTRDDPAERVLVAMLLKSEPDLDELHQPMAFPIFARGRALYALVGRGIEPANIREACEYVTEACSCEVKRQNPGVDLLVAADWDAMLTRRLVDEIDFGVAAERIGAVSPVPTTAPAAPQPGAMVRETIPTPWWPLLTGVLVFAVLSAVIGSVIAYVLLRKSGGRS